MPGGLDLLMQLFAVSQGVGNRDQQMRQDWKDQQKQVFNDMPKTGVPDIDNWSPNVGHPLDAVGGINEVSAGKGFIDAWHSGSYNGIFNPRTNKDHLFSVLREHDNEAKRLEFSGWQNLIDEGGVRFTRNRNALYLHFNPDTESGVDNALNVLRNHSEPNQAVTIDTDGKTLRQVSFGAATPKSKINDFIRKTRPEINPDLLEILGITEVKDTQYKELSNIQNSAEVKPLLERKAAIKKKLDEYTGLRRGSAEGVQGTFYAGEGSHAYEKMLPDIGKGVNKSTLKFENPLIVPGKSNESAMSLTQPNLRLVSRLPKDIQDRITQIKDWDERRYAVDKYVNAWAKQQGYDGIVHLNTEGKPQEIVRIGDK